MDNRRHIHHSRHSGFSYPTSLWSRLHSAFTPIIVVVVLFIILRVAAIFPVVPTAISPDYIGLALLATFIRLLIAYALALVISVPLALLVVKSPLMERIFLPTFDIAQSIPVLAFFPVVVIFFLHFGLTDAAAVFIIFLTMLWTMVFSLVGGLKIIPTDIKDAAKVFGVKKFDYLRRVLLPAIVPSIVTGSLLTWAQGWNIIIVAEVLRTYIPGGTAASDLFGIGSVLVDASANGQNAVFIAAILVMVAAIALLNFFVWQPLLHYAERYKFE
ncbi:MAG TPA: ABC transporter permease subunit [Candidatus Paceibacterota bacterium]|nr:ABC transporter permease subunit [Candidatus Paceibacterota bacterium]